MNSPCRRRAALLIGPTGSGKTPLGNCLASKGLWGRRCFHFDFGAELRRINAGGSEHDLSRSELDVVRNSLETGSVLEPHDYGIAGKLIARFIEINSISPADRVLLNGFPRDARQARFTSEFLELNALIRLTASPEVARERIRLNSGGDRTGRSDDTAELVERKLRDYRKQAERMIHFFEVKGSSVYSISVEVNSKPEEMVRELEKQADRRPVEED